MPGNRKARASPIGQVRPIYEQVCELVYYSETPGALEFKTENCGIGRANQAATPIILRRRSIALLWTTRIPSRVYPSALPIAG